MVLVEFFFDYSSPWTYLAFSQIGRTVQRVRARVTNGASLELRFRPMLVGGLFNTVNPSVYEMRKSPPVPAKLQHNSKDMADWAAAYGLKIMNPYHPDPKQRGPSPFPVNSVKSLRGALFADEHGALAEYSFRVFDAYWGHSRDISDAAVLRAIVGDCRLDADAFFRYIEAPVAKAAIRANTEECAARGGFGSPTIFVDGEMFFGNDRLPLVERRLLLQLGLLGEHEAGGAQFVGGEASPLARL